MGSILEMLKIVNETADLVLEDFKQKKGKKKKRKKQLPKIIPPPSPQNIKVDISGISDILKVMITMHKQILESMKKMMEKRIGELERKIETLKGRAGIIERGVLYKVDIDILENLRKFFNQLAGYPDYFFPWIDEDFGEFYVAYLDTISKNPNLKDLSLIKKKLLDSTPEEKKPKWGLYSDFLINISSSDLGEIQNFLDKKERLLRNLLGKKGNEKQNIFVLILRKALQITGNLKEYNDCLVNIKNFFEQYSNRYKEYIEDLRENFSKTINIYLSEIDLYINVMKALTILDDYEVRTFVEKIGNVERFLESEESKTMEGFFEGYKKIYESIYNLYDKFNTLNKIIEERPVLKRVVSRVLEGHNKEFKEFEDGVRGFLRYLKALMNIWEEIHFIWNFFISEYKKEYKHLKIDDILRKIVEDFKDLIKLLKKLLDFYHFREELEILENTEKNLFHLGRKIFSFRPIFYNYWDIFSKLSFKLKS